MKPSVVESDASDDTIDNLDTTTTVVGDVLEKQVMNDETGEVETQTIDLEAGDMPEKGADMGPSREQLGARSSNATTYDGTFDYGSGIPEGQDAPASMRIALLRAKSV